MRDCEYRKRLFDAFPQDVATEINRIAQILSARNQPGDRQAALDEYHQALDVLTKQQDKLWMHLWRRILPTLIADRRIAG